MTFKKGDNVFLGERDLQEYRVKPEAVFIEYLNREGYEPEHCYVKAWFEDGTPFGSNGEFFAEVKGMTLNRFVPEPIMVPTGTEILGKTPTSKVDRHPSSERFHAICNEMKHLHDKKQADYGRANDPFANVRSSEDFGMPPWVGCMVRANDKMKRIQAVACGSELQNEGVEDSFMDLAVYAIIGLILYQEGKNEPSKV